MRVILLFVCVLFISAHLWAQDYTVQFLDGPQQFSENTQSFKSGQIEASAIYQQKIYRLIQFYDIPNEQAQRSLKQAGWQLLEYIPNKTYIASLPLSVNAAALQQHNVRSIQAIEPSHKMGKMLSKGIYPSWALEGNYVQLSLRFYQDIPFATAVASLRQLGFSIQKSMSHANLIEVQVAPHKIEALLAAPFVRYAEVISEPGKPESDDGRNLHRSNAIDGDYLGALNYDGTGISFAINDDGFVGPHIDYKGRVNQQDVAGDLAGDHGDMCAGIAGGAGNLDPSIRGMATGSYLHIRQYNASMSGTIPLHQDSAVMIFSSSYSNGCNGGYTNTTLLVDQEIYNNPNLLQTFSAGNSNNNDCGYGAGNQWGNITGGHKIGKNVIATANLSNLDVVMNSSSRGPASDGRIKPDLSAHGNAQMSTDPNNSYAPGGGTSAAAPGICGVSAQLYHAYKDMNTGQVPSSALIKAAMLVTANDLGNDGPDFIYGWGKVNGVKAYQLLADNRYFMDSVGQGAQNTHSINIPAGVQRAKVMVYWADQEGSTTAATALVNDIDATMSDGSVTYLPWLLDHSPNATTLALPAAKGADHLNNMEEIAIDNPTAGSYSLVIDGTTIPFGTHQYYVVYEFMMDDIQLVYPLGGEGLEPGTTDRIHWDAYDDAGSFLIEYTTDNGNNWTTIASNVSGAFRFTTWTVPNTLSGEARIRVSRNGISDESDANFSIIGRPQNIRVNRVCPSISAVQLAWDAVAGATSYDIFMLGAQYMDSIGTTSSLNFNVVVADVDESQWFSVRANGPTSARGLRQIAINYPGSTGGSPTCYLSCISDNDAGVARIDAPGAIIETCSGITTTAVTINIENIGLFTESNIPVYYQFGNNPVVSETFTGSIASGADVDYTFNTLLNIPVANNYELKTWTGLAGDSTLCNDTLVQMVNVLDPVASYPYAEDFENNQFPPADAYLINPDGDITWTDALVTGSAGNNTRAMFINNFNYNAAGEEDIYSFVSMDMTQADSTAIAMLTFDVAYRQYSNTYSDDLRVDISTDCGQTFNQVYFKDGANLATGANSTNGWAPSDASDWRNDTVDLNPFLGNNIVLRFVNICGWGQNMYLDNINVNVIGALPPAANFDADVAYSCDGQINFIDLSGNNPSQWLWNFGDGAVSTLQNPTHTYTTSGTYNVSLQVTNSLGVDTETKNTFIEIEYPDIVSTSNGAGCPNTAIELSAAGANGTLFWYDGAANLVHVGDTFNTPPLSSTTNYSVQNIIRTPTLNAGPSSPTAVGAGSYHNSGFTGAINFTAYNDFEILSVWVDADGAGARTITLWDGYVLNGGGAPTNTVLESKTINLVDGSQRVLLNIAVPGPGDYSLGGSNVDLFRNNTGVSYPYTVPDVLSMNSSSASVPADYYYYFYDWNIRLDSCAGALSTVTAEIVDASFASVVSGGTAAFTDNSTGATSWNWDFGDGTSSTVQNPTHTYTSGTGPFVVTLSINNGACNYSDTVAVSVSVNTLENAMQFVVAPNPTEDISYLRFSQSTLETIQLNILSIDGKVLQSLSIPAGSEQFELNLRSLTPAMYLLQLKSSSATETRKITVIH